MRRAIGIYSVFSLALVTLVVMSGCVARDRPPGPRDGAPPVEHHATDMDQATTRCQQFGCSL